jgi:excinuclease UvrABC nuclease subunit
MPKIRIANVDFHFNVPAAPGVYKIFSLNDNDEPRRLPRVLGVDQSGILYIGRSGNLNDRLRMLWRVLQPNYRASAHTFGMNYKSLQVIQDAFPYDTLAIEFEENSEAKQLEKSLLEAYRQIYGEVPPLNGSK